MKIALLSPFKSAIREPFTGGTNAFIHRLSADLASRGHEVICYAPEGSEIPGVHVRSMGVAPCSVSTDSHETDADQANDVPVASRQEQAIRRCLMEIAADRSIDIVHNNSFSPTPMLCRLGPRTAAVHTMHTPFGLVRELVYALRRVHDIRSDEVVAVSGSQASWWRQVCRDTTTIWNGVPIDPLPDPREHEGTLAFVGRLAPEKGLEDCIQVARLLGVRLDVYGPIDSVHREYFRQSIKPLLTDGASYCGWLRQDELYMKVRGAQALLMPTKWQEPFGYAAVESMCLGVPVVAYSRGALPELVHAVGVGQVVAPNAIDKLAEAATSVGGINREELARKARALFSQNRSTDQYLEAYERAIAKKQQAR